jgi:integrase
MSNVVPLRQVETTAPNTKSVTVGTKGYDATRPNGRKHFYREEVELLREQAKQGRYGLRDNTMILMAYYHGLRSIELVELQWGSVNFNEATIHIQRAKGSKSGAHYLQGDELRALRKLKATAKSVYIFESERGASMTTASFRMMLKRLGKKCGIEWASPHALRHGCGYELINKGVDVRQVQVWMGHSNIQNTTIYTELAPNATKGIWG